MRFGAPELSGQEPLALGSALAPAGPAAESLAGLTWALVAGMLVIYAVVVALILGAARRRRRNEVPPGAPRTDRLATAGVVLGGVVVPGIVITAVLLISLPLLGAVGPGTTGDGLVIEVNARQWWWDVRYPDPTGRETVVTANELHIPVGRRVRLKLFSQDVIHSFWVPPLQGKLDVIPGVTNVMWIQADRAGLYRGQCAEYCGLQHANMALLVVAQPVADFEAWLAAQRRPADAPLDDGARRGQELFLARGCALCHTIRGTLAFFGHTGPDLTHLLSRRTLAGGVLTNSQGARAGWIANPQALKPGNKMPTVPLTADELHAIFRYVETLR